MLSENVSDFLHQLNDINALFWGVMFQGKPYNQISTFKKSFDITIIQIWVKPPKLWILPNDFKPQRVYKIRVTRNRVKHLQELSRLSFKQIPIWEFLWFWMNQTIYFHCHLSRNLLTNQNRNVYQRSLVFKLTIYKAKDELSEEFYNFDVWLCLKIVTQKLDYLD